jgi:nucleoside-diphosphate kinase
MSEQTLIIIKPDAVGRHLTGRIIARLERKGFKIAAAKFTRITEELAELLYAAHKGKPFFAKTVRYISSGPSLVMVWQGERIIETARKIIGATFGYEAEPGTIRGDFSCSGRYNLVHGSDSPQSARREIELFFQPEEIIDWRCDDRAWLCEPAD